MQAVQLLEHEQDSTDNFLGAIKATSPANPWTVPLVVNGTVITFGVDVTGIPETIFKQIRNTTLQPCSRALKGPCQNSLKVIGQFQGTLTHKSKTVQQDIFVLQDVTPSSGGIASNRGTSSSDQNHDRSNCHQIS